MPSKDREKSIRENNSASDLAADGLSRGLWTVAKALEGTADRMSAKNGKPDFVLMEQAGGLILQATRSGVIDSFVNLREVVPEVSVLLDEPRPTAPPEGLENSEQVVHEAQDSEDIARRTQLARAHIEEMLQQNAHDADPTEAAAKSRGRLLIEVLAEIWRYLSDTYPQRMSAEVAAIKHELLPGVDPWLGGERDFRKAAWVCSILASEIDERCDLSLADASKMTGVLAVTIKRALKYIKNNGKGGRELMVNLQSLLKWKTGQYDVGVKRRKENKKAVARLRKDKICSNPSCKGVFNWTTLKKCPHCDHALIDKH